MPVPRPGRAPGRWRWSWRRTGRAGPRRPPSSPCGAAGSPPSSPCWAGARSRCRAAAPPHGCSPATTTLRRPWSLELAGLPLGDPTSRLLAARLPTSVLGNVRSVRLVDELDDLGATPALRSRDPRVLERWLPALLTAADPRVRAFLRAT